MLAQNIAPKPAALPPATPPAQPAGSAGGPSFAQFLTEQAGPPAPPSQSSPPPDPADNQATHAESTQTTATATAAATRRANAQAAKPAAHNRATEAAPKADAKATPADKSEAAATTAAADADKPEETSELKEFTQLIGLQSPPIDTSAAARADTQRGRTAAASGDDAQTGRPALEALNDRQGARADGERATGKPGEALAAKLDELRADKAAAQAAAEPLQVGTEAAGSDRPAAAATPGTPSFAAVLAQALPTPAAPPGAAPDVTYAAVQAPMQGSAFAPELGARVSLLAVDGVQHAELQLNPADMGPVSVQIVIDGSQAQVSFHALQAETRHALEQSLPDLAAALQGQGLTLSGGGVFQQAPRDADQGREAAPTDGAARDSRAGGERVGGSASLAASPSRRTVGLLDAFA
jgi:flagellar hook-length control protein FliK